MGWLSEVNLLKRKGLVEYCFVKTGKKTYYGMGVCKLCGYFVGRRTTSPVHVLSELYNHFKYAHPDVLENLRREE